MLLGGIYEADCQIAYAQLHRFVRLRKKKRGRKENQNHLCDDCKSMLFDGILKAFLILFFKIFFVVFCSARAFATCCWKPL
jgi:hypothetical protein